MAKAKKAKKRKLLLPVALLAMVLVLIVIIVGSSSSGPKAARVTARALPCPNTDTIYPFGDQVLYYDGMNIHCLSATGSTRWTYQIGTGAGLHCTDTHVTAWNNDSICVLDQNGNASYNDNLGEPIQYARIGKTFVAAVIGEDNSPRLIVKDLMGGHMDEENDAYSNLIMLDVGFYGSTGQYLWTLALDVYGTVANTILNTFEVGKMNTGKISLGEPITYAMVYDNGLLRAINTRKMRAFTDRGTEDTASTMLVYGWHYLDHAMPERGNARLLFAPTAQWEDRQQLDELRLLQGTNDKRYSLPDTCFGAQIDAHYIFAFSKDAAYRIGETEARFTAFALPLPSEVMRYIGKLGSNRALVATADGKVYVLTLPE